MKSHRPHVKLDVLPDPRSSEEKLNDLHFEDFAMAVPVTWIEKPQSTWRSYTLRNQDGAGSCVGNGTAKALETKDKVVYSAHPVYSRRSNAPGEGMFLADALNIMKNFGTTTEALDPSNNLNEQQIDAPVTVATPKKVKDGGFITVTNLDAIANAIDTYGGCPITVSIAWDEWNTEQGIPRYIPGSTISGGHCLCAVDYILYKGEKALVIENSWGHDGDSINQSGQVLFTQSFLNARGQQCMFFIPKVDVPTTTTVTIKRIYNTKETPGVLTAGNFSCKTLELINQGNQHNISCIPEGTYQCSVQHFANMNIDAYELAGVPNRSGIFIHPGNYANIHGKHDTDGCILIGNAFSDLNADGVVDILNSRATFAQFMASLGGKPFTLIITS